MIDGGYNALVTRLGQPYGQPSQTPAETFNKNE